MSTWSIRSQTAGSKRLRKRERAGSAWILPFSLIAIVFAVVVLIDMSWRSVEPILNMLNNN